MRLCAYTAALAGALTALTGCGLAVKTIEPGTIVAPTARDHFARIDGVDYHYLLYPGPGPNVLLLHGFASSTYTWERVAPRLNQLGYAIVALDMKGFGWSDKPRQARYDALALLHEVHRFADELGWRQYALVGHSLGGAIAILSALERPERIERLVLIDAAAPRTEQRPLVIGLLGSAPGRLAGPLFFG
ncbi:MAG: alpha/beta fold hydrolase, partial [Deltaproteobacteria bacterium]|nr:alpha/beta fold hydrolase [Deltaproteobacteria bacterium]